MSNPGTIIAINSFPTEISAIAAKRTAGALGGIIIAKQLLPRIGPKLMGFMYFRFLISGSSVSPIIAKLAIAAPVNVDSKTPPAIETKLSLPGSRPNHWSTEDNIWLANPDVEISSPINIKRGNGIKTNVAIELKILDTSCCRPTCPPQNMNTPKIFTAKKQNATGSPVVININKQPIISNITHCHSNLTYSLVLLLMLLMVRGLEDVYVLCTPLLETEEPVR